MWSNFNLYKTVVLCLESNNKNLELKEQSIWIYERKGFESVLFLPEGGRDEHSECWLFMILSLFSNYYL